MKEEYKKLLKSISSFSKNPNTLYSFEFNNSGLFPFGGFNEFSVKSDMLLNTRPINNFPILKSFIIDALYYQDSPEAYIDRNINTNIEIVKYESLKEHLTKFNLQSFRTSTNLIFKQWQKYIKKHGLNDTYTEDFISAQVKGMEALEEFKESYRSLIDILPVYKFDTVSKHKTEFLNSIFENINKVKNVDNIINIRDSSAYKKLNQALLKMHEITIKIKEDLQKKNNVNFITHSDDYIKFQKQLENVKQSDVTSLIFNKFDQEIIEFKVNLSKSQKFEEFIYFSNGQFLFKDSKGNYIEPKDSKEANELSKEFLAAVISFEFRKKPNIAKFLIQIFREENNPEGTFILMESIKENYQILKNINFDFDPKLSIEGLTDKIEKSIKNYKVKNLATSIMSNKYKHLYSEACIPFFETMFDSNFSQSQVQDFIGKKIASCKNSEDFLKYIESIVNKIFTFSKEKLEADLLKSSSAEIIIDSDDIVVLKINEFNDSKLLGTSNWCISRENYYFDDYAKNNNQYFVYDFSKDTTDPLSLIGLTLFKDGRIKASHDKQDYSIKNTDTIENISSIIIEKNLKEFPLISENPTYSYLLNDNKDKKLNKKLNKIG